MRRLVALLITALFGLTVSAVAQAPPPAAPRPLLTEGGFERFSTRDNLWDGVDGDGFLAGSRGTADALTESGTVAAIAMPISVALQDLTNDGIPDLLTADPTGLFRFYQNTGTKTEAKFTNAEMVPLYVSRVYVGHGSDLRDSRVAPKISLYDWDGRPGADLLVGLYSGEVMMIPNAGGAMAPAFPMPRDPEAAVIPTSDGGKAWGNLFAPDSVDWNGDGRVDLLVGEGSYSANAIHLLLNQGAGSAPKFSDAQRYYLAYGDGREQLHPAAVDYNGDGKLDLLVSDRKGTIAVHLNSGAWKPGEELKQASLVSLGSTTTVGGVVAITTGDFNGDGLFDLVLGKNNGRIAVALNSGTKTEPKFGAPVEIKGTDVYKRDIRSPSGWEVFPGERKGNTHSYIRVVGVEDEPQLAPPEGKYALKAGYHEPLNKLIKAALINLPAFPTYPKGVPRTWVAMTRASQSPVLRSYYSSTQTFVVGRGVGKLQNNKSYEISFKYKGQGVRDAWAVMNYMGFKEKGPAKVTRGDRGSAVVQRDEVIEHYGEIIAFTPGAQWGASSKAFQVKFKDKDLQALPTVTDAGFMVVFELPSFDSTLYLDDVKLVEK